MKKNLFTILLLSILTLLFSSIIFGQNTTRDISAGANKFVISAEAGGVNYVEGTVSVLTNDAQSGYLTKGDNLKIGEEVSTGTNGRAEILLNPGSFVRLGAATNFEFITTSLEDLKLKVNRGSAIFEVITDDEFKILVNTPKANFYLIKSGIYRLDVSADGTGRLEVWKGRAQAGDLAATQIKKKNAAIFDGEELAIAKFDRDDKDSLEQWSESRSEQLAKSNSRFDNINLRNSLISGFNLNRWNFYNSYGLWVYNSFYGNYCFLPFGRGWRSPYGYGYNSDIWTYGFPTRFYYQPSNPPRGNISNRGASRRNLPATAKQPPFTKIKDKTVTRRNTTSSSSRNNGLITKGRSTFPSSRGTSFPSRTATPSRPAQAPIRRPISSGRRVKNN